MSDFSFSTEEKLNKPLKMNSQEFADWLFIENLLCQTQYCIKHKDYFTGGYNVLKVK